MSYICNDCDSDPEYQRIGQHWAMSSCDPPDLSDEQYETIVGLMMGDGTIGRSQKGTVRIEANMITPEYLHYLDDMFPVLGNGVHLVNTAEENAKHDRESGFNESAEKENYSDTYRWKTMTVSTFDTFGDWYESGKKVWPDETFTPTILKHLYCCDGYKHDSASHNNITISMDNEINERQKIDRMFKSADLPTPTWQIYENGDRQNCAARFTKDESLTLWNYMGEPLPGFEYKWPEA